MALFASFSRKQSSNGTASWSDASGATGTKHGADDRGLLKTSNGLIVRLARENSDWGNGKIQGELVKLGYSIDEETVANILKRYGIAPASLRKRSSSWRQLMTHYEAQILACDFFTVETVVLKTLYVMVFIELGSRRVHFAGCTAHPKQHWVTQQARQLVWELEERDPGIRFLIHDNDVKFTTAFDAVFQSEHIKVIHAPVRVPNANAYIERWGRTVRAECLNKVLIINQVHLRRVLSDYIDYYNRDRAHQGIEQRIPIPQTIARRAELYGVETSQVASSTTTIAMLRRRECCTDEVFWPYGINKPGEFRKVCMAWTRKPIGFNRPIMAGFTVTKPM